MIDYVKLECERVKKHKKWLKKLSEEAREKAAENAKYWQNIKRKKKHAR